MDWTQVLIPLITVLGIFFANAALIIPLFLWNRAESRADWRKSDSELKEFREIWMAEMRDMDDRWINTTKEFSVKMENFSERWLQESKDFHKRLCEIEAKRNK